MRDHFHVSLKREHAEAERFEAMSLLVVGAGALVLGLWCVWTQWPRLFEILSAGGVV